MSKRLSAILAAATLGLSAAAFAQTGTTQNPSAAPSTGAGGSVNTPADRTGSAGRPSTTTQSGTASSKPMSATEVRHELEKQGYSNVSDVKRKGDHYEAKGMKDGKTVSLNIDAKSGKVVAR
jgi:hypothetical protein